MKKIIPQSFTLFVLDSNKQGTVLTSNPTLGKEKDLDKTMPGETQIRKAYFEQIAPVAST